MTAQQHYQIVVGYDFSDTAQIAIDRAIVLADADSRNVLHIVTVLDEYKGMGLRPSDKADFAEAERAREQAVEGIKARLELITPQNQIRYCVHVRIGKPADELLGVAQDVGAHLLLVGSHGRTGLERLVLGSVSERIVREAKCPVLVVRPREYADVKLLDIVDAPADHAEKSPYIRPHRYSYTSNIAPKHDRDWPLN